MSPAGTGGGLADGPGAQARRERTLHGQLQVAVQDQLGTAEDDPERAAPAPVVQVQRPGCRWRGRLVLPAMVRVRTE